MTKSLLEQIMEEKTGKPMATPASQQQKQQQEIKKEAKKQEKTPLIKEKKWFEVRVETMLPATLKYRVLAEDHEQALQLIKGASPNEVKHKLIGKKDIKLSIYLAGSSLLLFTKNLLGF